MYLPPDHLLSNQFTFLYYSNANICTRTIFRGMMGDVDRIKCKICGSEVQTYKYHRHVMAFHID